MKINYIITCGTSQLDHEKLFKAFPTGSDAMDDWIEKNKAEDQSNSSEMITITCELEKAFDKEQPGIPDSLGAELSTLKLLRQKQGYDSKTIEVFTVLASDSNKGQLAAEILTKTLKKAGLSGDKETVLDLDEEPATEKVIPAMKALIQILYKALQPKAQNKLIITGGFKSILPCITLFATLNGLEMYYLFEKSDCLQSLETTSDNLKKPDSRHKWMEDWKKNLYYFNVDSDNWINDLFDRGLDDQELYG